ncbi:MAG: 50S ribosomal protein L25 [Parachlamydiaceae bacterium]
MKLKVFKRELIKKSESKRIRREGNIPAVVYSQGKETHPILINGTEFSAALRSIVPGRLASTVFTLTDESGKEKRAIIKDIQYNITSYKVQHLDFELLLANVPISLNVPIECVGAVDCIGVKLGGVLRLVIRQLRVRCLPKDIPSFFTIDVRSMGQNDAKRLSDLEIPKTVRPIANLNEVAVIIAKR